MEASTDEGNNETIDKADSTTENSSNGTNVEDKKNQEKEDDRDSTFECNICLEPAVDPVISLCGHLFCWPCIYQWIERHVERPCPVCKSALKKDKLIPLYGRGKEQKDPRNNVPTRPPGQRSEPTQPQFQQGPFGMFPFGGPAFPGDSNFTFSVGFGMFPSLFGLYYNNQPHAQQNPQGPPDPLQADNAAFSRMFLIMGILTVLALMTF